MKAEDRRLLIGHFYEKNKSYGKTYTVNHFVRMGMKKNTIYQIIKRVENGITLKQRKGQGRPVVKMTQNKIKSLKRRVDGKAGISQRRLAQKYGITQSWVGVLLKRNGIRYFKRQSKPKTTDKQRIKQKRCLIKMSKNEFRPKNGIKIVMDDESYFPMSGQNIPGNDGFYTSDRSGCDSDFKNKTKHKFPMKIMVWIAISESGHSAPYFARGHGSVNSEIYAKKCIRERLTRFIRTHHSDGQYIFWPDGATVHYGQPSKDAYIENGIKFVERDDNPPNVPQLRPIERFWAHLKTKVYSNDWKAISLLHLESRIRSKIREFSPKYFQDLMKGCKTLVRRAADLGADFMFN